MRTIQTIGCLLLAVILIVNCSSPKTKKDTEQHKTPLEEFMAQAAEIMPDVADPTDIAILWELTAADYMPELTHDPLAWENYKGKPLIAAANFGMYTADAIYQYTYNETEAAYLSWMAAKSIAADLGFADIFDQVVIKRIEEGLTPIDSFFRQIDNAIEKMGASYTESDKFRIYTSLLTGNYIEKVHIVMGTLLDTDVDLPDATRLLLNRELLLVLIRQLQSLEQLIDLIEQHETIDDPGFLSLELKKMRDIFNSFNVSAENLVHITPDQVFKNEKINELREHLGKIRIFLITGVPIE